MTNRFLVLFVYPLDDESYDESLVSSFLYTPYLCNFDVYSKVSSFLFIYRIAVNLLLRFRGLVSLSTELRKYADLFKTERFLILMRGDICQSLWELGPDGEINVGGPIGALSQSENKK